MPASVTALPRRGSWSWRFTPLTSTARPFTSSSWPDDLDPSEADVDRDDVDLDAQVVEQGHVDTVQVGRLGAPRSDGGDGHLDDGVATLEEQPVGQRGGGVLEVDGGGCFPAVAGDAHRPALRPVAVGADVDDRAQPAIAALGVVVGGDVEVGDVDRRRRVHEDVTVQARVVPVVLVLEVGGVGPAHDRERQLEGATRLDDVGEVDLVGQPRVLAHGERPTVDVHVQHRLCAAHVQHDPLAGPRRRAR